MLGFNEASANFKQVCKDCILTRMHSSRMRTAHTLTLSHSIRWDWGSAQPPTSPDADPPSWTDTHLWKYNPRKLRLRAVVTGCTNGKQYLNRRRGSREHGRWWRAARRRSCCCKAAEEGTCTLWSLTEVPVFCQVVKTCLPLHLMYFLLERNDLKNCKIPYFSRNF